MRSTPNVSSGPPVVLLGGGSNAVSVARSLGSIGVSVFAIGASDAHVRYSRFCERFIALPDGEGDDRWFEALRGMAMGAVALPCSDAGVGFVARRRPELRTLGLVGIEANDDVALAMLDKLRTYELARTIGVATPWTFPLASAGDLDDVIELISYPCLLKPRESHVFVAAMSRKGIGGKVLVANDRAELDEAVKLTLGSGLKMIVSEIIPGSDDQLFSYTSYIDENGDPLLEFAKVKLRQYPVGFGTGSYHISVSEPEVADLGLRFFRGIGLRGLAYVEFKRDARDGDLKLIECNHRFGAANELARLSGIDLSTFTYARLTGKPVPSPSSYRTGVRLWHAADDVRAFIDLRKRGELSLIGWLRSLTPPLHFCVFRLRDPGPTVGYHWHAVKRRLRKRR